MDRTSHISRTLLLLTSLFLVVSLSPRPCFSDDLTVSDIRAGLIYTIGKPHTLTISSKGSFDIVDAADPDVKTTVDSQQIIFAIKERNIEVSIAGIPKGSFKGPLRLVPKDADTVFEVISPKVKYARYRHVLEITGGSSLIVVNELPLEDYVKGVIPTEIAKSFHPEAQKALVVAIRTYAVRSLKRHASDGFNLCGSTHCQGFSGASREASWVDELVDATKGQIITYKDEPIYAVYSTDCGGATQNNEDAGMGKDPWPYLRSVIDNPSGKPAASSQPSVASNTTSNEEQETSNEDYCAGCQYHTWNKIFSADDLDRIFSRSSSTRKIGKFKSMEFTDYDSSGRVKTVIIKGEKGEYRMTGTKFRELFGESVIMSSRMILAVTDDGKYAINGKGYGHGIGLCAFGANGLAKSDKKITYTDILKHYYTGIEINTIKNQ